MANFKSSVDSLASVLQNITLPKENGVSFAGLCLKFNEANDAKPVVEEIEKAEAVEFLNLEGNSLGVAAAEAISKALMKRKEFKKALWKDMFTGRIKSEIPVALRHLGEGLIAAGAKLEVLDLSDNASGPIGVEGFEDLLRSPVCYSLKELRLNNMGLGIAGAKKLASALLELYNNSKNAGEVLKLKVFIAGRNRLENEGATALAQVFQKIGTLEEVSVPQNGIYYVGIEALSRAFEENTELRLINLNDNTLTWKGGRSLGAVLPKLKKLEHLDLGDCLLKTKGGLSISEGLSRLTQLDTINLSFNMLKPFAGLVILNSLEGKESIKSLGLDGNQFGPDGVELIKMKSAQANLPLGSLSEDEGDDVDDEDEGTESGEHDSDAEEEEYNEGEDIYDQTESEEDSCQEDDNDSREEYSLNLSGTSPLRQVNITGEQFLMDPSIDRFLQLGDKANAILHEVKRNEVTSQGDELMSAIVKVSCLMNESNASLSEAVISCALPLYKELTMWGQSNGKMSFVNNRLPVHFGYIKDEVTNKKRFVPNQYGCLTVLRNASACVPKETFDTVNFCCRNGEIKKF